MSSLFTAVMNKNLADLFDFFEQMNNGKLLDICSGLRYLTFTVACMGRSLTLKPSVQNVIVTKRAHKPSILLKGNSLDQISIASADQSELQITQKPVRKANLAVSKI